MLKGNFSAPIGLRWNFTCPLRTLTQGASNHQTDIRVQREVTLPIISLDVDNISMRLRYHASGVTDVRTHDVNVGVCEHDIYAYTSFLL